MDRHPHQPHLIALGREDGSLCFWDLRQESQPVQLIEGHSSDGEACLKLSDWHGPFTHDNFAIDKTIILSIVVEYYTCIS